MSGPAGVEIPKGDPGALRAAAGQWESAAELVDAQGRTLSTTATAVTAADWHGDASMAYGTASATFSFEVMGAAAGLREAARAAEDHATELDDAQDRARAALRDAEDALARIEDAQMRAAAAAGRAQTAATRIDAANHAIAVASAAGPAGSGAMASAQVELAAAGGEVAAAEADRRRAEEDERLARADLTDARARGETANDDARRAGQDASAALERATAQFQPPANLPVPVPVSLRGADPAAAALGAGSAPYLAPGRFRTPADARAAQIASARTAPPEAGVDEGGMEDRFGGELAGLLGVRLFGDPNTRGFQQGEKLGTAASFFPSPASLGRHAIKTGGERLAKEAVEQQAKRHADDVVEAGARGTNRYPDLAPEEVWRPEQGIPVLGRIPDTSVARGWPGHSVLNLPEWTIEKNRQWIDSIVDQRGSVYLGSPADGNLTRTNRFGREEPTVFAQEIEQLEAAGYRRVGDYMVPPKQ